MTFHILTIFPNIFSSYFNESILKRAQKKKTIKIKIYNIRNFSEGKYKKVDDRPYGGGAGMVMMVSPIVNAVNKIIYRTKPKKTKIVLFSAKGQQFDQKTAFGWSKRYKDIIMICGRYEGIDERAKLALKAQEISIGPYVLTDGEVPAMILVSSISRLLPGTINWESLQEESFFNLNLKKEKKGILEYPHYTRPEIFNYKGKKYGVPKVLLSGDHKKISEWRKKHGKMK